MSEDEAESEFGKKLMLRLAFRRIVNSLLVGSNRLTKKQYYFFPQG